MLEQEIASVMNFIIKSAGNPAPYYWNVPEDFIVPAVYFPVPEISSDGDTLNTYALSYIWYIKFFHKDTQSAHELAFAVFTELLCRRNHIPLIDETGEYTDKVFRAKDPEMKKIDDGTVQLTLTWDSRRPYYKHPAKQMTKFYLNYIDKSYKKAINKISETEDLHYGR